MKTKYIVIIIYAIMIVVSTILFISAGFLNNKANEKLAEIDKLIAAEKETNNKMNEVLQLKDYVRIIDFIRYGVLLICNVLVIAIIVRNYLNKKKLNNPLK